MKICETHIQVDADKSISLIALSEPAIEVVGIMRIDPDGYIMSLFIREDYRNKQIGTSLVNRACEVLKEAGKQTVGLSVHVENEGAQRLYKRLGFLEYIPGHDNYKQLVKVL